MKLEVTVMINKGKMYDLNKRIGQLMREEREKAKMSLDEVLKKMGYASRNTVSRMELGQKDISVEDLQRFSEAVGFSWIELLKKVA